MLEEEKNRLLLELQAECEQLRQRNAALVEYIAKIQSTASSLSNVPEAKAPTIQMRTEKFQKSTLNKCQADADNTTFMTEKITLFKSLFKGRRDVYALRWQARDGRSGYSPACANEWNRQFCAKPKIKCNVCQERKLLPLTEQVLYDHLIGKNMIGIYPLLPDETCYFLAVDFDKTHWQAEALAFIQVCHKHLVPAILERSQSGNGAHVWIFFAEAIKASIARSLGTILLAQTMQKNATLKLSSYDRLFPNQDCLPKGGFGNLIALPLQGTRLQQGNSVFLDLHFNPYPEQWHERLSTYFNIPAKEIGIIGGGKNKLTGLLDIAMLQSVAKPEMQPILEKYGQVIVDECHHISANSFEKVLKMVQAKYILGLTATPTRKDGRHPIILMQCGPVLHQELKTQASKNNIQYKVFVRKTAFVLARQEFVQISELYNELITNVSRNEQIINDVTLALKSKRTPLVLTNRIAHLEWFKERLEPIVSHLFVLQGGIKKAVRDAIFQQLQSIPEETEKLILATGSYIGEGFDHAQLDTLFLTMPVSWHGTLQQYVGRLHRQYQTKKEILVYDYVDVNVPIFSKMYQKRVKKYCAMGYSICEN